MNLIARKRDSNGLTALPLRVNQLFDNFFDFGSPVRPALANDTWTPPLDVIETDEAIEVHMDLPGIDPRDVDLSIQEDRLEIAGTRSAQDAPEDARWYRFERAAGAFHRALRLPVPVDADKVTATTEHGCLHVVLPKIAAVKPKRISIKGR